jgi:tyrosinase
LRDLRDNFWLTALRYWDWTLDWDDLAGSPIFSPDTGFGGDGGKLVASPLDDGSSCVIDGPFQDLKLMYMNSTILPHCLARGFIRFEDKSDGAISGDHVQPNNIVRLMEQQHYFQLGNFTEYEVHNAIHWGLRGDFAQWSSANGMAPASTNHIQAADIYY